jgi:hypothetical protein
MNDLLDAIDGHNPSGSDSYEADCPECGADDQLVIWPDSGDTGTVWCRNCNWGGNGIQYVRGVEGMTTREAFDFFGVEPETSGDGAPNRSSSSGDTEDNPDPEQNPDASSSEREPERYWKEYEPPSEKWRASALAFCGECKERLWSGEKAAKSALSYLHDRGFNDRTIEAAGLGVNVEDRYPKRTEWGLEPKEDRSDGGKVWLPRGVVIPWANPGGIAGVNIRRPSGDVNPNADDHWERRKYQRAPGPSAPLYGAPVEGTPVVLVEGELDALAVLQEAEDLVSPVATGSASGARRERWRTLLAEAPAVLVSFDEGEAGERASEVWKAALPNAIRWPPHADDTGEMLQQGRSLRTWVRCGLEAARRSLR